MIKWIKALWTKLFPKKSEVVVPVVPKAEHCGSHSRYKKSCKDCNEVIRNA